MSCRRHPGAGCLLASSLHALPCVDLRCVALPSLALPRLALPCHRIPSHPIRWATPPSLPFPRPVCWLRHCLPTHKPLYTPKHIVIVPFIALLSYPGGGTAETKPICHRNYPLNVTTDASRAANQTTISPRLPRQLSFPSPTWPGGHITLSRPRLYLPEHLLHGR